MYNDIHDIVMCISNSSIYKLRINNSYCSFLCRFYKKNITMTFRETSLIQKALLNSLTDDIEYDMNDDEQTSVMNLNSLQLNPEQTLQLGLNFFNNREENVLTTVTSINEQNMTSSPTVVSNEGNIMNTRDNHSATVSKSNQNLIQFVIQPVENNSSLLNRSPQVKLKTANCIDEFNELLSFNNDEEGSVYLQNNIINKKGRDSSQLKQIITKNTPKTINSSSISKPIKYIISQPVKPNVVVNSSNSIILSNSESILKDNLLNTKSVQNKTLQTIQSKPAVSLLSANKQNQLRSILLKPKNALPGQLNDKRIQSSVLNKQSLLCKNNINNGIEKKTTVIKHNGIKRPVQVINGNNTQNINIDLSNYKINWNSVNSKTLDNNDSAKNANYALKTINEIQAESFMNSNKSLTVDFDLLNKAIPVNSKLEDSIVPLINKKITDNKCNTGEVQKAMQKYTVNTNKPLGSTENPIKLLQRGQTYQSLHSLNESQLQQIAGALKQRPPSQQSGYREPHKVVLYDSETSTRIIYRIVYPDELNLKPAANMDGSNKSSKEKRKRKTNIAQETNAVQKNNQPLPRTRTGRVIRPPNRMMHDFKKLRKIGDDSDKDEWVDAEDIQGIDFQQNDLINGDQCNSNIVNTQSNSLISQGGFGGPMSSTATTSVTMKIPNKEQGSSVNMLNLELPVRTKKLSSKFRCPTCNKYYLGYGKMSKHLQMFPDHGEIDKLGIEPRPLNVSKTSKLKRKNKKISNNKCNTDVSLNNITDDRTINKNLDICQNSLFDCLMKKVAEESSMERWQKFNKEIKTFMQRVESFMKTEVIQEVTDDNKKEEDMKKKQLIQVDDTLSRLIQLKPGLYQLKELTKETSEQKATSSPSINKFLESTMSSIDESKSNTSNNSIDLAMLCSTESDFEKNVMSESIVNNPTTLQQHMDMLIENEQNISQSQHISQTDITVSNSNSTMDNLNSVHNIVSYHNVDDLVQESLKNLTADEIASAPSMAHQQNGLNVSHTALQDLSLDLFQFHHS